MQLVEGGNAIGVAADSIAARRYAVTVTRAAAAESPAWGERLPEKDIDLSAADRPRGLWSNGETLWVADWRKRLNAYRLADGQRHPGNDIDTGKEDEDPSGLWSDGRTLLATNWQGSEVRAFQLPGGAPRAAEAGPAAPLAEIPDAALRARVEAALGKAPGEPVSAAEFAGLEALPAREAGIRDLTGLEGAAGLKRLDLSGNPLADLRALAALNLDGVRPDLWELATLAGLRRLSLRHNGLDDLRPLAGVAGLAELDVGGNGVEDLTSLAGLEALDLRANRVRELHPLAGMARLSTLRLGGNGLTELHALAALASLAELGIAGNRIGDFLPLEGPAGLIVAGRV